MLILYSLREENSVAKPVVWKVAGYCYNMRKNSFIKFV